MKVGIDDLIAAGASSSDLDRLPRQEIAPPMIHLLDIEQTDLVGRTVQTDIVIAGVGETFHVPRRWHLKCGKGKCSVCPVTVDLGTRKEAPKVLPHDG